MAEDQAAGEKAQDECFNSLAECIEALEGYIDAAPVRDLAIDEDTGDKIILPFAKYLFRGEPGDYSSTIPASERYWNDPRLLDIREDIDRAIQTIERQMRLIIMEQNNSRDDKYMSAMSTALLQHYGLPTGLLDVSSNILVAAHFAANADVGSYCRVGVFDVEQLHRDQFTVIDLCQTGAVRPVRQSAYAIHGLGDPNYKTINAAKWWRAKVTEADKAKYRAWDDLLAINNDPMAGWLRWAIDNVSIRDGGFSRGVAEFLANRVEPVPLMIETRIDSNGNLYGEMRSLNHFNVKIDIDSERERNRIRWTRH